MCKIVNSIKNVGTADKKVWFNELWIKLRDDFDTNAASDVCKYEMLNMVPKDKKLGPFCTNQKEYTEYLRDLINARSQQRRSCHKNNMRIPEFWVFLVERKSRTRTGS